MASILLSTDCALGPGQIHCGHMQANRANQTDWGLMNRTGLVKALRGAVQPQRPSQPHWGPVQSHRQSKKGGTSCSRKGTVKPVGPRATTWVARGSNTQSNTHQPQGGLVQPYAASQSPLGLCNCADTVKSTCAQCPA